MNTILFSRPHLVVLVLICSLGYWMYAVDPFSVNGLASSSESVASFFPKMEAQAAQEDEPAREVIGGLRGFTTISTVQFAAAPTQPHTLETNYIFPDRVRWWLSYEHEFNGYRRGDYRYGDRVFSFPAGSSESEEFEEPDTSFSIRSMELRRALFLWPAGFEWKLEDGKGVADLGKLGAETSLGFLKVELDENQLPKIMKVFDADLIEQESLEVLAWKERAGRNWPSEITLTAGGTKVWLETVEKIDPSRRYVDNFFIPVDRREGAHPGAGSDADTVVRQIDLSLVAYKNFELPEGTSWKAAEELGQEIWKREDPSISEIGNALDAVVRFEINALGQPTFAILRLLDSTSLPDGWQLTDARTGLMMILDSHAQLGRSQVDQILKAIPPGSRPTPAYVRGVGGSESKRVQIVLPLVPN